jgi:hypothetical protein
MDKFSLEVNNWGEWELERDFSSIGVASRHARERFAQNEWRVIDRITGEVVLVYDPNTVIESEARNEQARFQRTERWRQAFSNRAIAEVIAQQQREQLVEVASRQRATQRQREEDRRARLRGFRFDGDAPAILRSATPMWVEEFAVIFSDSRRNNTRVNWLKEGF